MTHPSSSEREVDQFGNCIRCGGIHYGTGLLCVFNEKSRYFTTTVTVPGEQREAKNLSEVVHRAEEDVKEQGRLDGNAHPGLYPQPSVAATTDSSAYAGKRSDNHKVEQRGDTPQPVDSNEVVTKRNQLEAQPLPAATDETYNFIFWAKRLLEEEDSAQNCGDHCRNSCRWCGLRSTVERAESVAHSNLVESSPVQ